MAPTVDWNDPDTNKEMKEGITVYKAEEKRKDIIRILSKPEKYYVHTLPPPAYYCNCSKINGRCILCERGVDRSIKAGCVIVLLASKMSGDKEYRPVGEVMVWLFGKDKWNTICGIMDDYDQIKKDGLNKHDLFVTCKDEQFQDLTISPTLQAGMFKREMVGGEGAPIYKKAMEQLKFKTRPADLNRQKKVLGEEQDEPEAKAPVKQAAKPVAKQAAKPAAEPTDMVGPGMGDIVEGKAGREPGSDDGVDDILDGMGESEGDASFSPEDLDKVL